MTTIALYSKQTVLAAGLQAILAAEGSLGASWACTDLERFTEVIGTQRPGVLLVEWTADASAGFLAEILDLAGSAPVVLWVDAISTEFASQAISQGIRGILRKNLSVKLQLKCLQKVAAGELWVEKELSDTLLYARRIALSQRERQVTGLVAQGLKNKEIADSLQVAEGTIKTYLARLLEKVGANDRFDLALLAWKNCFPTPAGLPAAPFVLPSFLCIRDVQAGIV